MPAALLDAPSTAKPAAKQRVFFIQELTSPDGSDAGLGVKFEWDNSTQTAPTTSWDFGIQLRTVREDYPGADVPTEQVLGYNYTPFTVSGRWDDKYAGAGFAETTRNQMEKLFQRGSLVKIGFEKVTITGLITKADFTYKRSSLIGYSLTVSPHFRVNLKKHSIAIEDFSLVPPDLQAREQFNSAAFNKSLADQAHAAVKAQTIAGTAHSGIGSLLRSLQTSLGKVDGVINGVVGKAESVVNTATRMSQAFASVKTEAQNLLTRVGSLRSDVNLAWDTAMGTLEFEAWSRGMGAQARAMILGSETAIQGLKDKADPKAKALYRPHQGEHIYAISQRFYGTPHRWRQIAERNRLAYFVMLGTEFLVIPEGT